MVPHANNGDFGFVLENAGKNVLFFVEMPLAFDGWWLQDHTNHHRLVLTLVSYEGVPQ